MPTFAVIWEIDVEAEDARSAAIEALRIQRKSGSRATVFEVANKATDETEVVDLDEEG